MKEVLFMKKFLNLLLVTFVISYSLWMMSLSYSQDTNDARTYFSKAWYYVMGKNYKEAVKLYDQAIKLKPDYAEAYCYRGMARYNLKDSKGAIQDFTKAIQLKPDFGFAYENRGGVKSLINDKKGAIEDYEKTKEIYLKQNHKTGYNNMIQLINELKSKK